MAINRSAHELELAKELLDDLELSRLSGEALILKASRLARLCGTEIFQKWLSYEMKGYYSDVDLSLKYMGLTGRWTNKEEKLGYWGPLANIEAAINTEKMKLDGMISPNISGTQNGLLINREHNTVRNTIANNISKLSTIRSKVLGILHDFVSGLYYEKEFDSLAESIFEAYKKEVDTLITEYCGDIIKQIPAVVQRLAEDDGEAISQALTTVRRIIDSFSDSIFPPSDETYEIGGNKLSLDSSKHLNRINVFVHQRVESKSRREKIRQNLANLYGRVSSGVHSDVSKEEAKALFLNCYLLLGEVLHIGKNSPLATQV